VHPDAVSATLRTLVGLVERLAEGRVPGAAIDQARASTAVRQRLFYGANTAGLAIMAVREHAAGRDPAALDHHAAGIAAVDAEALAALVAPCAGHEVLTVVGPASLGEMLAPYEPEEVDWRGRRDAVRRDYGPPKHIH
jgi:hypothetical protein